MLSNTATPIEYGRFQQDVLNGAIPVNEKIIQQMERIDDDIRNPDFYYDDEAIQGYIDFCENELTLTDGSDLVLLPSFKLWAEDLLAWFHFPIEEVFDPVMGIFIHKRVKRRLRNKQYLIVGRGAAKTLYVSSQQAYGLTVDYDTTHGITVSPTMKQSDEVLQPIRTALLRSRGPMFNFMTQGSNKSRSTYSQAMLASTKRGIENKATNSILEIKPMDIDKLQSLKTKYNSIDEWLSGKIKEDVTGAIEQGASKVPDYWIIAVSSEGTARDGVGDSIKMELDSILRGDYYNPHVSIWYYKLDDVSEVGDPQMWRKANPNLGATVTFETYRRDVERMEAYPAVRNDILAKRFGIPVEGYTYFFTYEEIQLHRKQRVRGLECSMGMDASQGDDFWAFTWLFPLGQDRYILKTRSYVSEVKYLRLPQATQMKYDQLAKEGSLVIMPGAVLNWLAVYDDVDEYIERNDYSVISFGYDPYNAKEFVERYAQDNGDLGLEVIRQGAKTESVPLGELKAMAQERSLIFDQELMKYAMGNAIVLQDNNGNYKLSKKRSDEKIDNVAALLDAYVAFKRNQEAFM